MSCRKRSKLDHDRRRVTDSLGERLYTWRERCNLSQSEAALKLKVSTRTLQEWEPGRATPVHLAMAALEGVIGSPINPVAVRTPQTFPQALIYVSHVSSAKLRRKDGTD